MYHYFFRIDTLELMVDIDALKRRFESLLPTVDERMRRLIAAAESLAIDYGGISIVSRATGVSRRAIARGIDLMSERWVSSLQICDLRITPYSLRADLLKLMRSSMH